MACSQCSLGTVEYGNTAKFINPLLTGNGQLFAQCFTESYFFLDENSQPCYVSAEFVEITLILMRSAVKNSLIVSPANYRPMILHRIVEKYISIFNTAPSLIQRASLSDSKIPLIAFHLANTSSLKAVASPPPNPADAGCRPKGLCLMCKDMATFLGIAGHSFREFTFKTSLPEIFTALSIIAATSS